MDNQLEKQRLRRNVEVSVSGGRQDNDAAKVSKWERCGLRQWQAAGFLRMIRSGCRTTPRPRGRTRRLGWVKSCMRRRGRHRRGGYFRGATGDERVRSPFDDPLLTRSLLSLSHSGRQEYPSTSADAIRQHQSKNDQTGHTQRILLTTPSPERHAGCWNGPRRKILHLECHTSQGWLEVGSPPTEYGLRLASDTQLTERLPHLQPLSARYVLFLSYSVPSSVCRHGNHIKTRCLIRTTARSSLAAGAFYRTSTLAESSGVWSWIQDRVLRSPYIRSAMMALGMCHCRH